MIPFPFNENRFSFFVADHLLVGQFCTNPKSDRSLLSCLKVARCSMSEIGDALLYNLCSLPIQVMTTGPLPAPSKCKSGLPRITGTLLKNFGSCVIYAPKISLILYTTALKKTKLYYFQNLINTVVLICINEKRIV